MTKEKLTEEDKKEKYKQEEKPIHNQVEGVILILIKCFYESFHGMDCCVNAKVRKIR
jgi:hypothetical protein